MPNAWQSTSYPLINSPRTARVQQYLDLVSLTKLRHTTFVDRARNYVTQRAENWNRFNSSSATFRLKLRSATLVANSGSAARSTTGSVSNRSAQGNGRP